MKVEAISLMLMASLAMVVALPLGTSAPEREERARKDSARLRLLEAALAHGSKVDKERLTDVVHPKRQEGDQEPSESKIVVRKSESIRSASKTAPTTTTTMATTDTTATTTSFSSATPKSDFTQRLEKQRSVADQALRERLMRHTGPQKEQRQAPLPREKPPPPAATKAPPERTEQQQGVPTTYPPVVYVPLSDVQGPKQGGAITGLRLAPYVPATFLSGANRASWPFSAYFPVLINDPYQAFIGSGPLIEYGEEADVCRPKNPARDAAGTGGGGEGAAADAEIAMAGSGYVTKVVVRGGGVAIAGPGGVATAGRGGTAIVGPGGVAYTRPGALAVVGPGGKVLSQRNHRGYVPPGEENSARHQDGVLVARGPVIYYDDFEERE